MPHRGCWRCPAHGAWGGRAPPASPARPDSGPARTSDCGMWAGTSAGRRGWGTPLQGPSRTDTAPARAVACRRCGAAGRRTPGGAEAPPVARWRSRVLQRPRRARQAPRPPGAPLQDRGAQGQGECPPVAEEQKAAPQVRRGRYPRAAGRGDIRRAGGGPSEPPDRGGSGQGACLGLVSGRGRPACAPFRCTGSPVCHAPLSVWCAADIGVSSSPAPYVAPCCVAVKYFSRFSPPLRLRTVMQRSRPVPGPHSPGRSYWIPGSWNVRMSYTDDISVPNP